MTTIKTYLQSLNEIFNVFLHKNITIFYVKLFN